MENTAIPSTLFNIHEYVATFFLPDSMLDYFDIVWVEETVIDDFPVRNRKFILHVREAGNHIFGQLISEKSILQGLGSISTWRICLRRMFFVIHCITTGWFILAYTEILYYLWCIILQLSISEDGRVSWTEISHDVYL